MDVQDDLPSIEFDPPPDEPWRFGLNPWMPGYRKRFTAFSRTAAIVCALAIVFGGVLWTAGRFSPLSTLMLFVACGCALAVIKWARSRTDFCALCGASTKSPLARQRLVWCPGCSNLNDPAKIGIRVSDVFDVTREENFYHTDPILRFLAMTICLAVLDKGRKITYEPTDDEYFVRIEIDNETYELEPPPQHIHFAVSQAVKAMAGLDLENCSQAQEGRIDIRVHERMVSAGVQVKPTQSGQTVVLNWG